MEKITEARGLKTSEFWLVMAFVASVLLDGSPLVNVDPTNMTLLAVATFGYGGGRTLLKNSLAKASKAGA